jgi:hypothetical protein
MEASWGLMALGFGIYYGLKELAEAIKYYVDKGERNE